MSKISFAHFESTAKEIGWSEIKSLLTIFYINFAIFALIWLLEENASKKPVLCILGMLPSLMIRDQEP